MLVLGPIVIRASDARQLRPLASGPVARQAGLGDSHPETMKAKADKRKESKPEDKGSGNGNTGPAGGNGDTGPGGGGPGVIVIGPIVISDSGVTRVSHPTAAEDSSKQEKKPEAAQ